MNKRQIYKAAEIKYGIEAQIHVAIEEFCEASSALARWSIKKGSLSDVLSELADVEIMSEQLRMHFGAKEIDEWKEFKLDRLANNLEPGSCFKKPVAPETESP